MPEKTLPEFLTDRDLAARYQVSRSAFHAWIQRAEFPKPVRLTPGTTRWRREDVLRWEASRAKETAA